MKSGKKARPSVDVSKIKTPKQAIAAFDRFLEGLSKEVMQKRRSAKKR